MKKKKQLRMEKYRKLSLDTEPPKQIYTVNSEFKKVVQSEDSGVNLPPQGLEIGHVPCQIQLWVFAGGKL